MTTQPDRSPFQLAVPRFPLVPLFAAPYAFDAPLPYEYDL